MTAPKRIQMSRQHAWRPEHPDAVIVDRRTKWGNPFVASEWGQDLAIQMFTVMASGIWKPSLLKAHSDGDFHAAYKLQERWRWRIGGHPIDVARSELAGRDLACWCQPGNPCHADILLALANGTSE